MKVGPLWELNCKELDECWYLIGYVWRSPRNLAPGFDLFLRNSRMRFWCRVLEIFVDSIVCAQDSVLRWACDFLLHIIAFHFPFSTVSFILVSGNDWDCAGHTLLHFVHNATFNQSSLSDWNAYHSTPCRWTGIQCSPQQHVLSMWGPPRRPLSYLVLLLIF